MTDYATYRAVMRTMPPEPYHMSADVDCRVTPNVGELMAAALAARMRKYNAKMLQVSARFYALSRMYHRKSHAKKVVLSGKPYRPLYSRRIPDWCVKGERIIDYRSQFLPENITPAMAAYARSLAMERRGLEVRE